MNKITTVNLGGYPFTIDQNAYDALSSYLGKIESHFADSEGCDEILDDIETRIAELFTDYLQGKSIVTMKEYHAVVKVMGRPEDFGAEASFDEDFEDQQTTTKTRSKGKYAHIKTGKRLFRDEDDKVIGGVCAGVAAYFGVSDPLWIRLGFVALVFIGGISVLLYPLLWAIVPGAKTAGDKLKMRGEPATVSNIAKTVEEELTELSNKISEMSKDLGSKKKVRTASILSPKRAISGMIALFGRVFMGVFNIVKVVVKPIFSLVLGVLLLTLGIAWAAWIIGYLGSFSFLSYIGPSPWILSILGRTSLFFTVGIPILGLMLLITKWFSNYRVPQKWASNMWVGWVGSFVITACAMIMTGMSFNHESEISERASFNIDSDIITVKEYTSPKNERIGIMNFDGLRQTKGGLLSNNVYFNIEKSSEDEVVIKTNVSSHGMTNEDAQNLAASIDANYIVEGSEISLPSNFKISKGNKFRGQNVHYTIYIPTGKTIKFDESLDRRYWSNSFFKSGITPSHFIDYEWEMTEEGLVSEEWNKQYQAVRQLDVKNLANLNIDGDMETYITYGSKSEIILEGNKKDLDRVEEIITADATSLKFSARRHSNVVLRVTTPRLKTLSTNNIRLLKMEGFKQEGMEVNFSGKRHRASNITGYLDVENLTFNVGGYTDLNLIGSGENLTINVLGDAKIVAENYKAKNVEVTGNLNSNSTFYASEKFAFPKHQKHRISLFGNPELLADNMEKN